MAPTHPGRRGLSDKPKFPLWPGYEDTVSHPQQIFWFSLGYPNFK
ncbi:hypothetical protein LEMLEM_LOCUS17633 [Lemmus lemmus]